MNWWMSVVEGAKSLGNGAKWVWDKAPIQQTASYFANTAFYSLEQVLALRDVIPAMASPPVKKIINGAGSILFYDMLPILTLHYANNSMQGYFQKDSEKLEEMSMLYSLFLSSLSLVDYGVKAYTFRQSLQLFTHTLALDSRGPAAFNAHKENLNLPTLCKEEACNFKREVKGSLREPLILALNDLLLDIISMYFYQGKAISWVVGLFFYGEYITRLATPERCERHKAMKSESTLALGLTYAGTSTVMDYILKSTVGMPPYLYLRTLRHLLLLGHINIASHMVLPLDRSQKDTISMDPLVIYDYTRRFVIDVILAGLINRIPIDFKPQPNAKPFISLSTALKFLTQVFDSDLEQVKAPEPGILKKAWYLLPSMFRSPKNAVNDPVIRQFWPQIRNDLLYILNIVEATKPVKTLTTAPTPIASTVKYTLPAVLNLRFGLPIKLSEFLLSLSKKEDFWNFVSSLKLWLERNNVAYEVILTKDSGKTDLYETNKVIELPPKHLVQVSTPPAIELKLPETPRVTEAKNLISQRPLPLITAKSLISTKKRSALMSNTLFKENKIIPFPEQEEFSLHFQ